MSRSIGLEQYPAAPSAVKATAGGARRASEPAAERRRFAHYLVGVMASLPAFAFSMAVATVLFVAWQARDEGHITAETGVGYWLGIAGATMMGLLFLYPLRKRVRFLHGIGRVAGWFRLHMIFGVIGPALIVLHSNFKLGSLNSMLALLTMLTVVASGIVGRFLYGRIHKGLYGSQLRLQDVVDDLAVIEERIGARFAQDDRLAGGLRALAAPLSERPGTLRGAIWQAAATSYRVRRDAPELRREARMLSNRISRDSGLTRREIRARSKTVDRHLAVYVAAVRKASRLALFERLFALWHVFHLPLFILLALTTVIHIVAVHLY